MIALPIDPYLEEVTSALLKSPTQSLVLTATPGSGKTTRIPPALISKTHGAIWILEPRRIAARAAATRVAQELKVSLGGNEVGYQVRFEKRASDKTKLVYLTEGMLQKILLSNPYLEGVEVVILDEFHERSIHTDLALAMVRQIQETVRPDLKLLVMSATLSAKPLSDYLGGAPILNIPGNIHPIQTQFENQTLGNLPPQALAEVLSNRILGFTNRPEIKDILVFLPGKREIDFLKQKLEETPSKRKIEILHGQLDLDTQSRVLAPQSSTDPLRIILATNVAETSLTVDRVNCVIDSGLLRILETDFDIGIESLRLKQIPAFSAVQRLGRAGRQGPGFCHRLWTRDEDLHLEESEQAEILRVDLAPTLLSLAQFGVKNFDEFPFFDPPPPQRVKQAEDLLFELQLINEGGITSKGKEVVNSPLDYRLASSFCFGRHFVDSTPAEIIHNLLEISDDSSFEKGFLAKKLLEETFPKENKIFKTSNESDLQSWLALKGFPDRLGKCRDMTCQNGLLVGGRGLEISDIAKNILMDFSKREGSPCFFIAPYPFEIRRKGKKVAKVEGVFPIKKSDLLLLSEESIKELVEFTWNSKKLQVEGKSYKAYHDLPLGPSHPISEIIKQDSDWNLAVDIFIKNLLKDFLRFVSQASESFSSLVNRLYFYDNGQKLPEGFLRPWIEKDLELSLRNFLNSRSLKSLAALSWQDFPFSEFIDFLIPWDLKAELEREVPEKIGVPSGQFHPILYPPPGTQEMNPKISLRLQEVFGWEKSPTLGKSKTPIVLELLSPGFKLIQTTRDLSSFWKGVYLQIRGELRAKYPKHSWPDDPLSAIAVAKGRRRT